MPVFFFKVMGGEVGGDVKELLSFFIDHVFVEVFQYDSGTPKHALKLKEGLNFLILPKRVESSWFGTQGPKGKIQGFE